MTNSTQQTGTDAMLANARKIADSTLAEVMQRQASEDAREIRFDRDLLVDALVYLAQQMTTSNDVELAASGVAKVASVISSLEQRADGLDEMTTTAETFKRFAAADVARAGETTS